MSTTFQTDYVAVTRPEGWTDNSSPDVSSFISRATLEELTIGTWKAKTLIELKALPEMANRFLQVRAKALVETSHGPVDILDAAESGPRLPCVVRFTAFCKNAQVFCNALVIGYPTHLVGITYYRYGCAEPNAAIAERSMEIVTLVAVKER